MTGTCVCGKIRYFTRREARREARVIRGHGNAHGRMRAYQCEGGFWHLTTWDAKWTATSRAAASRGQS